MAVKVGKEYACSQCGKVYAKPLDADACRDSHNLIYIPMTKTELNMLNHYIQSGDQSVLPNSIIEKLEAYQRRASRPIQNS